MLRIPDGATKAKSKVCWLAGGTRSVMSAMRMSRFSALCGSWELTVVRLVDYGPLDLLDHVLSCARVRAEVKACLPDELELWRARLSRTESGSTLLAKGVGCLTHKPLHPFRMLTVTPFRIPSVAHAPSTLLDTSTVKVPPAVFVTARVLAPILTCPDARCKSSHGRSSSSSAGPRVPGVG